MCFSEPLGVKKNVATNLCVKQPLVSVDLFEQPSKQMFLVCSVVLLACFKRVFLKHLMHHKHFCDSRSFCCVVAIWFQEIVSSFLFGRNFLNGREISQCFCYAQRTGRFGPANLDHHCEPFCNCSCHQFCSRSACNLFLASVGLISWISGQTGLLTPGLTRN